MVGHGCALLVNEHNIVKLNWSTSSGSRLMGRCLFICNQITKSSDGYASIYSILTFYFTGHGISFGSEAAVIILAAVC